MQNSKILCKAMILVGGKGTRLQSVVNDLQKPMVEVAGQPFLEWLLRALQVHGVRRVILCTCIRRPKIEPLPPF